MRENVRARVNNFGWGELVTGRTGAELELVMQKAHVQSARNITPGPLYKQLLTHQKQRVGRAELYYVYDPPTRIFRYIKNRWCEINKAQLELYRQQAE